MIGARLRQLRKERGMSQQSLATQLKLARTTLTMYETDQREPDHHTLHRIADLFQVSTDYLLGRTDDPTPPRAAHDDTVETEAAHRTDDPMADLPEEARRSLLEFQEYIRNKYGKKTE